MQIIFYTDSLFQVMLTYYHSDPLNDTDKYPAKIQVSSFKNLLSILSAGSVHLFKLRSYS